MPDDQIEQPPRSDRGNGSGQHDPMQAASSAAGQASEAIQGQMDEAKRRAADGARQAADAAREAARNLRGGDQAWLAGLVERGADGLADLADTLRGNDMGALLRRAEEFARSQPVLFAGAAFAVGFALTRVARTATTQTTERREYGREH